MIEVREYVDAAGTNHFRKWADRLDQQTLRRIQIAIARMEQGNLGDVRPIGSGLSEHRVHVGPGYRLYFGKDRDTLIILLAGGTKKRQQRDIKTAKALWRAYQETG